MDDDVPANACDELGFKVADATHKAFLEASDKAAELVEKAPKWVDEQGRSLLSANAQPCGTLRHHFIELSVQKAEDDLRGVPSEKAAERDGAAKLFLTALESGMCKR